MDESTDAISKDCRHQLLKCRGCIAITHLHYLASGCAKYCSKCRLMDMFRYDAYLFIRFRHQALSDIPPWPYHDKWYPDQGTESHPGLCCHSVLIDQKQYIVYHFSLVCRALAPLDVPLQVSTTVQWCISQFSERVLCENALGILAIDGGYTLQDQLDWSCGLPPR